MNYPLSLSASPDDAATDAAGAELLIAFANLHFAIEPGEGESACGR